MLLSEIDSVAARVRCLAALVPWAILLPGAAAIAETGTFTFGSEGNVTSFPYNGTAIPNLTIGDLTKVGATSSSSNGNFRASNWALDGSPVGGLTGAPDLGKYFQFTISADTGYSFDLDTLTFGFGRSGTGPRSSQWRSSVDNYAAPISSYSSLGTSGQFSQSAGALSFTGDVNSSGTGVVLGLSGSSAAYQGLSTVGLRWYGYNAEASGGTGGFQGPLSFAVTVNSGGTVDPSVDPPVDPPAPPPSGAYDPPAGYYTSATGTGADLKAQLNAIIDDHVVVSYDDARSILQVTDADPAAPGRMILAYDRVSLDVAAINPGGAIPGWDNAATWNREHTWPNSRGLDGGGPDYSDLHHLRPTTTQVNTDRGNKNFGGAYGQQAYGPVSDGGALWYPGDADAGMVARHEFYMATRYDGADASTIDLELSPGDPAEATGLGSLTRLVEWHYQAVPDEFELRRNQIIYSDYQNNRNPYIDRPEYVWSVFVDQENDSQLYVGNAPAADGGSTVTVDLGRVIVGGEVPAAQNVTLHRNGFDGTYYEVTAAGDATTSVAGRFNAFPINSTGTASRTLTVGLDASTTATAGQKSGTVTIGNLDVTTEGGAGRGANDADDVITTSLAVLSPATPSFLADSTSSSLTLDFGTLVQGAAPSSLEFDIFNLVAGGLGSEWTAGLDLDSIVETDESGVFSRSISPFTSLAAGSSTLGIVSMGTDLIGSFSGSLLLNFSDEDLPGATTSSMTVQLQGVVAVPEPATVMLAAAGLLALATGTRARRQYHSSRRRTVDSSADLPG